MVCFDNSAIKTAGKLLGFGCESREHPAIVAVVGCGGKTTFIESLAREYADKRVLITPTTQIMPMTSRDVALRASLAECLAHRPAVGLQCLGALNEATGKLEALPPEFLSETVFGYDIVLLEADGSRGLPCKGWLDSEPVIPSYCTHTVGIVTLDALGEAADESRVLRLPEFLCLTGLREGDIITRQALVDMVCAENGMFRRGMGRQSIFVNRAETGSHTAAKWLESVEDSFPGRFAHLAYGDARTNSWKEINSRAEGIDCNSRRGRPCHRGYPKIPPQRL